MKKVKIYILAAFVLPMFIITGCELAGLDLQEPYEYDANAGVISNELNKSVWDFLNSRTDAFSLLLEGIEYAELTDMYNESNSTYMVLTNTAINDYFNDNQVPNPLYNPSDPSTGGPTTIPVTLESYPKEKVREFLLYHIAKGAYTWNNLPPVRTWYPTYAAADTAMVNLYLMKNDRSPTIGFNDFVGHHTTNIRARTTNLKSSSGSFVHVLDAWLNYPTRAILNDE